MKDPLGDIRTVDPFPYLIWVESLASPHHGHSVGENVVTLVHQFLVLPVMLGQSNIVGICKVHCRSSSLPITNYARYFLRGLGESGRGEVDTANSKLGWSLSHSKKVSWEGEPV